MRFTPMHFLMLVFAILCGAGLWTAHFDIAGISAFMIVFTKYGERELDKRDAEFFASPAGAQQIADTMHKLVMQEQEATASRL